jgi:hypothetical protein
MRAVKASIAVPAVSLVLFACLAACRTQTKYDYPEDLSSSNYLKRTYAAQEFAQRKDVSSASQAFVLLTDEHITLRSLAHETLRELSAGEDFGYRSDLSELDRRRVALRWQSWWERSDREGEPERG